jgi:hypothetical protein
MSTRANDEADILHLLTPGMTHTRSGTEQPLTEILADDFTGLTVSGVPITKAI